MVLFFRVCHRIGCCVDRKSFSVERTPTLHSFHDSSESHERKKVTHFPRASFTYQTRHTKTASQPASHPTNQYNKAFACEKLENTHVYKCYAYGRMNDRRRGELKRSGKLHRRKIFLTRPSLNHSLHMLLK